MSASVRLGLPSRIEHGARRGLVRDSPVETAAAPHATDAVYEAAHSGTDVTAADGNSGGRLQFDTGGLQTNSVSVCPHPRHQSLLEGVAKLNEPVKQTHSSDAVMPADPCSPKPCGLNGTAPSQRRKRLRKVAEDEAKSEGGSEGEPRQAGEADSAVQPISPLSTSSPDGPQIPVASLVSRWPSDRESRFSAALPSCYTAGTSLRHSELSPASRLISAQWASPLLVRRPALGSQSTCLPVSLLLGSLPSCVQSNPAVRLFPQLHASRPSDQAAHGVRAPGVGESFSCPTRRSASCRGVPVRFTPNLSRSVASSAPPRPLKREDTSSAQKGRGGGPCSGSEHRAASEQRLPLCWGQGQVIATCRHTRQEVREAGGDPCAVGTKKEKGTTTVTEETNCDVGHYTRRRPLGEHARGGRSAGRGEVLDGALSSEVQKVGALGRRLKERGSVCASFGFQRTTAKREKADLEGTAGFNAEHGGWKREAAEGFEDRALAVDDGYPPMCLPLRKVSAEGRGAGITTVEREMGLFIAYCCCLGHGVVREREGTE